MIRRLVYLIAVALMSSSAWATIPVGGFGDIGFKSVDSDTKADESSFYIGGIDFYYTTNLDEKTTVLAEIVYEFNDKNEAVLDPERLYIQYNVSPLLKVKAGREHTAFGYWNNAFHHGTWLAASTNRPLMYRFEDDGGILPVHNIGVELSGSTKAGEGELSYALSLGNGRGKHADPPQNVNDASHSLSTGLNLFYTINDLRVGVSYYQDKLPLRDKDQDGNAVATPYAMGDEKITGAHVVYTHSSGLELLAEHTQIKHSYDTKSIAGYGDEATITAGYAQISYQTGKWTPYYRADQIKADTVKDQYLEIDKDKTASTVGVRYDLTNFSALKLESSTEKDGTDETKIANFNWSFTW